MMLCKIIKMNYRIKLMLVLLVVCFSCNAIAQKSKGKLQNDTTDMVSGVDPFVEVIEVPTTQREIDSLKQVISQLESENQEQVEINQNLKRRLLFTDSCFLRVSNDCFRKKYDKVKVDEAIANFGRMYSPQLQKSFAPLKTLLENYGNYYKEIMDLFTQIDNDRGLVGHLQKRVD